MSDNIHQKATRHLDKMFGDTANDLSLDDIWHNTGREDKSTTTNMQWLYNVLVDLTKYNLVTKSYEGRNLKRIKLTEAGKKALNRGDTKGQAEQPDLTTRDEEVTFSSVQRDVNILQARHPDLKIVFYVSLDSEEEAKR
jgi:DNA-binding PadR family transcriptional regulator